MQIFIGCDHAAVDMKNEIIEYISQKGHEVVNMGTNTNESVDYPVYAQKVANGVIENPGSLGILICGTGIGMSLAANKVRGIRAACVSEPYSARLTRLHNDANIICFGARVVGLGTAQLIVDEFLETEYEGARHLKRVSMISKIENGEKLS